MVGTPLPLTSQQSTTPLVYGVLYQSWLQADGTSRITYLSDGAEELLEASAAEITQMLNDRTLPIRDIDQDAFYAVMADSALKHAPWSAEFGYVGPKTGTHRWFRAQDFPQVTPEGVRYFSGVLIDMTELKRTQERYAEAHHTLSSHIDNTPLAVIEWDAEFRVKRWSGQAETIFGWTAQDVLGKHPSAWRIVHVDDRDLVNGVIQRLITKVEPRNVIVNRNYHKSGHVLLCEWHNSIVLNEQGEMVSVLSLVLDRTQSHQDAEALARSEGRLRSALRSASMLGWDYDMTALTASFSEDYWNYFGFPPREAQSESLEFYMDVIHQDDRSRIAEALNTTMHTQCDLTVEFRRMPIEGEEFPTWYSAHGELSIDPHTNNVHLIGVTTNITKLKRAEVERAALDRELQEARKRESLGILAGGIAHDFNNILTVILGNAGLVRAIIPPKLDVHNFLETIEKACQRAASLCRQMVAYAGVGRLNLREADLNHILHDVRPSLNSAAPQPVRLTYECEQNLPHIKADPVQIRQLLFNLVENAAESLPNHEGLIQVSTSSVHASQFAHDTFIPKLSHSHGVLLRVKDHGSGMSAEVIEKMFDPFFSTKFTGRGLGLAAVQGIVRSHQASIRVVSEMGHGTTIDIFFPSLDSKTTGSSVHTHPVRLNHAVPELEHRSTGKILIVDDEENIRTLTSKMLTEQGMLVDVASDGMSCLSRFQMEPSNYRLIVVDYMMPKMTGDEVISRIRRVRKDIPIILMTGHTDSNAQHRLHAENVKAILSKPFSVDEFLAAVRHALQIASPPTSFP